jgi:hypothetical protein
MSGLFDLIMNAAGQPDPRMQLMAASAPGSGFQQALYKTLKGQGYG